MGLADNDLLSDLAERELISQATAEQALADHLNAACRTVYCGFDPTADSLHIGSLVPLLTLRRFQLAGHRPIALVGGATGLIGDPSFKVEERKLNTPEVVAQWLEKIKGQVSDFVDFDCGPQSAIVVNNLDWMEGMDVLSFLRRVGKHFPVNQMIRKESVRQRLEREGEGISYTEFTYMILQAYDFAELNRRLDCTLQIGGSDQWGNITGGIELSRRLNQGAQVYGLTQPLVTKADGSKFGKTESGTIWLDAKRTSPYAFFQFWQNTADADVYRFLRYFTFLSPSRIREIEAGDAGRQGRPSAPGILATEVCRMVHGESGLQAAQRITAALFEGDIGALSEGDLRQLLQDGLPATELDPAVLTGRPLTGLLADCGVATSGKQVKDALQRGAVLLNGVPLAVDDNMRAAALFDRGNALYGQFFIVRLGKKNYHLFVLPRA